MRKFLMAMTVLAGATVAAGAYAAPVAALPSGIHAAASEGARVQPVQYYGEDWRYREFRRREAYERFRRHEARREWRREHEYGHGYGHGHGYGGGYGRY